jgi:hypothetical protein
MLMLMDDNNNRNAPQTNVRGPVPAEPSAPQSPEPSSNPTVTTPTTTPTTTATEAPLDSPAQTPIDTPSVDTSSSIPPKLKTKKPHFKPIVGIIILVVLFGAATTAAFYVGKHKRIVVVAAVKKNPISLPPQAIVISQCTPGRGKQYIIPADIPDGPIYDVKNSQVIAIEYILGVNAIISNSNSFSSTILQLTTRYPVDHFTVLPLPPKPGDTDEYIRLIVFVVSKAEANSITCK